MSDIPKAFMKAARGCAQELLADITDRRGWRQAWDQFEDDARTEIADAHSAIVARALMAADEAATKRERERCAGIVLDRMPATQDMNPVTEALEDVYAILKGEA